jgi:hypothetical protein
MRLDRLLVQAKPGQRIAKIGLRCRKIRLQRERLFLDAARLGIASQLEKREAKVGMGIRRTRIDGNGSLECLRGLLETRAIDLRDRKQMQAVEIVGQVLQYPPTKRLGVRMPALPVSGKRDGQHLLRLLSQFLLLPRILEGAGTGVALQGRSPGDSAGGIYHRGPGSTATNA